jgi:hypothetical protein
MPIEAIRRVHGMQIIHHAVPGNFSQDGSRADGHTNIIAANQGLHLASIYTVQIRTTVAINSEQFGRGIKACDRALHSEHGRTKNVQGVNFRDSCQPD